MGISICINLIPEKFGELAVWNPLLSVVLSLSAVMTVLLYQNWYCHHKISFSNYSAELLALKEMTFKYLQSQ